MEKHEIRHLDRVLFTAHECTLFLKKNDAFPLKNPTKVALFGSGARHTLPGGTGSGEVNYRHLYTFEEGLEEAGFIIASKSWLDQYDEVKKEAEKEFIKRIKKEAKVAHQMAINYAMGKVLKEVEYHLPLDYEGEVAIYVLSRNAGEGADREYIKGDIFLTDTEIRDILYLNKHYEKFMLVLNVVGPVDLSPILEIDNILLISQLGALTGKILPLILLGKNNPSGKLASTWARKDDYPSSEYFGDPNDTYYQEGVYVGYRYFSSFNKEPLFPFGFGLSYSSFDYALINSSHKKEMINLLVEVENTSSYEGKEVIQVYVNPHLNNAPKLNLVGFKKTKLLKSGNHDILDINFRLSDISSYDESLEAYVLYPSEYDVLYGNASNNLKYGFTIVIKELIIIKKVKNILAKPPFIDLICDINDTSNTDNKKVITLTKDDFDIQEIKYYEKHEIDQEAKELKDEDLALLCTGSFNVHAKGIKKKINNNLFHVAGIAGETTSFINNVKYLTMSDGPQGLRLSTKFYFDKKGYGHALDLSFVPERSKTFVSPFFKFLLRMIFGKQKKMEKGAEVIEKYASSIPTATSIAQSFSEELALNYGDLVGVEMEIFNINLFLAPALNIHRDIRCGRNFEYYSEDPLLSGLMAANIVKGIEAHEGCAATIKHFAANNQETNRYQNSSWLSERALREIYIRGFEICIRESSPKALMTSYNLINGKHTSEYQELVNGILRDEFHFKGMVMSDWIMPTMDDRRYKHRGAHIEDVIKAGNDIFMPGSMNDYIALLNALKNHHISREDLEMNATRILRIIHTLKGVK